MRQHVAADGNIRPINNVKIYGGPRDQDWCRDGEEGQERFWRNIFAGHAAVRFHRPPSGIGLSPAAQKNIRSARLVVDSVDFFSFEPANGSLGDRDANEAYCLAGPEEHFLLYFPASGAVTLDAPATRYDLRRLDLATANWESGESLALPGTVENGDKPSVLLLSPLR